MSENKFCPDKYDLLSGVLLFLCAAFSLGQIPVSPQFMDSYYHLSCANAFLRSGGWVGMDWWSIAPAEKAHLYPPLFHFLLSGLRALGLTGLQAIRLCEFASRPLFFFALWLVFRRQISAAFAFYFLLLGFTFFPLYVCVSGNLPASLAIIFGVLAWAGAREGRIAGAALLLGLAYYTHTGAALIFSISMCFAGAVLNKDGRGYLKSAGLGLLLAGPMLCHQLKHMSELTIVPLVESLSVCFDAPVIGLGLISFCFFLKTRKNQFGLLFCGYLIGSGIVFFKYPYRLLCAQGALGFIWPAAAYLGGKFEKLSDKKSYQIPLLVTALFFFLHPVLNLNDGKLNIDVFSSTYAKIISGAWRDDVKLAGIYDEELYGPVIERINRKTAEDAVISSNSELCAQIFSALSARAGAQTTYKEIGRDIRHPFLAGNLIVWLKNSDFESSAGKNAPALEKIYENEMFSVFNNPKFTGKLAVPKAEISFSWIILALAGVFAVLIFDMKRLIPGQNRHRT